MTAPPIDSVDEYIATFPKDVQFLLENIRTAILSVAPEAEESIAYGMPAYKTNSMPLVYFACFKSISGSMPPLPDIHNFPGSFHPTNREKVPFNSLWINQYPLT